MQEPDFSWGPLLKWAVRGVVVFAVCAAVYWVATFPERERQAQKLAKETAVRKATEGYFRQIVKLTHAGHDIDLDVVVNCNIDAELVKKFGLGAATHIPRYYAERTSDGHAVGFRPTSPCSGNTTDSGRAPADLLPSVIWYPNPRNLSQGILYATEDAYHNPLSQLKFRGSTIHKANADDFATFKQRAAQKAITPWNYGAMDSGYLGSYNRATDDWIAKGTLKGEPYWVSDCAAVSVQRIELSEKARDLLRKHWPENRPRYWTLNREEASQLQYEILRAQYGPTGVLPAWGIYMPDVDGLPTKAGGGMLRGGTRPVVDVFPVTFNAWASNYDQNLLAGGPYRWTIDFQNGKTKGFAYCLERFAGPMVDRYREEPSPRPPIQDYVLPDWTNRPRELRVDTTPVQGFKHHVPFSFGYDEPLLYPFFERDTAIYRWQLYD